MQVGFTVWYFFIIDMCVGGRGGAGRGGRRSSTYCFFPFFAGLGNGVGSACFVAGQR